MTVARITEITSSSKKSFDDAIHVGVQRATTTLQHVSGAWVAGHEVVVENDKVTEYRVRLKVTFILKE
jgi:flavin-binding protein dodecin